MKRGGGMSKLTAKIHIGPRTIKTAAAVIIAMAVVELYGATTSRLIFAMLGAMAAVQPTFTESLESCIAQIVGVLFGALMGIMLQPPLHPLVAAGIGIVLVITLYNTFHIRFSPSLPCLIVVTLCTTPDIKPAVYALGRIWDSAIGLGVGMLINTLILPYDNSKQIRATALSLDRELILFLEDMFDGDDALPGVRQMMRTVDDMARQLRVFSNQRLLTRLHRQQKELETFRSCEQKARELVARLEVLSQMEHLGRLNEENRRSLKACGANIRDERLLDAVLERDVVTNYHVRQILRLRRELLAVLERK